MSIWESLRFAIPAVVLLLASALKLLDVATNPGSDALAFDSLFLTSILIGTESSLAVWILVDFKRQAVRLVGMLLFLAFAAWSLLFFLGYESCG